MCSASGLEQTVVPCPKAEPICALGVCLECLQDGDCGPAVAPCTKRVCTAGACADATLDQTPGDCAVVFCDTSGQPVKEADPTDLPADDGNMCTADICLGASPAHPALPDGTPCGGGSCLAGICKKP